MKKYILILLIAFSTNLFAQMSFGLNYWNVYGYNHSGYNFVNQMNLVGINYRGFYMDASLDITSTSRWGSNFSPSYATGYWYGSPVSTDNHTVLYKRQGFPCGTYEIDLDDHDDGVRCYVNGAQVYEINSCCADRGVIYTGYLDANSTVEFRVSEGGGGSNLFVDFDLISNTTSSANYVSGTSCNQYNINVAKPSGGSSPWFVSNLAEAAPNTQINGVATYVGNGCRLTPNSAGQYGSLAIDNPVGYNASDIDLNYDFYIGNGGGADGMSISYGSIPMNSNNGEFGSGTGVRIRMKTYYWSGPKVQLMYNNVVIATYGAFPWRNAQRACSLSIVDGRLTYIVAGTTVFNSVDLGASYLAANKTAWRWVFAARTGGVSDDHYIYNLKIHAKEYEYSVGAGWQSSSTFSNLTGGNTYTVQARPKFSSSCITTVQTITLPNTTPTTTTASGGGTFCDNTTITAAGGAGGTIYFQGTTSNGTSTVTASTSETITISGTYYFRSRSGAGCWGPQGSVVVTIETAPTAPTSITGTLNICSGSSTTLTAIGGSEGSGATYQWYAGGCDIGALLGTTSTLNVSPITNTVYYVRRVGNTSCTNTSSCASQMVMVNGSAATPVLVTLPAVTAMVPVVTTTSTCIINDANWHHLYDANGDLLAAINSNGENLGSVAITIEVGNAGPFSTGLAPGVCGYPGAAAGEYALARNWEITVGNQPTIPVDVKFYYEASEVTDLTNTIAGLTNSTNYINCWGNVTSESDLMMTVSHTGGGTQLFPSITSTAGPGVGIREISFSLTEFSSGILHSNGGIHSANPLPVELLSFEAKPIDNEYIQINWITATEINNDGFELLRSKDGLSFEKIAWIKGNGNYSQKKSYSYNDTKVSSGTYYYKLRQIDFDGKFEDFNVISVSLSNKYESAEIVVRPIPTSNTITLDITSINNSQTVISVYNYSGQKVLELNKDFVKGENSLTIEEVSQFSSGIYYINLTLNNKVFTKKFVVSK